MTESHATDGHGDCVDAAAMHITETRVTEALAVLWTRELNRLCSIAHGTTVQQQNHDHALTHICEIVNMCIALRTERGI